MSRTYKDRKDNKAVSFARKKQTRPLRQKYIRFVQSGYETSNDENNEENLDGNFCPKCKSPTHFESYFLTCASCGWMDAVDESVDLKMQAFDSRNDELGRCAQAADNAESDPDHEDDSNTDANDGQDDDSNNEAAA